MVVECHELSKTRGALCVSDIADKHFANNAVPERMKMIIKIPKTKKEICTGCYLKKSCGDLPYFCMILHYTLIVSLFGALSYFFITMDL
jgi:hypothetical protein